MITNRTIADVLLSKTLRLKIQSGQSLTDSEKESFERGTCTITMLNRINNKIVSLENELNNLAYRVKSTTNTDNKTYSDILIYDEYLSIFSNLNKLKESFYVYSTTPTTPSYLYGYIEANNVEQILVDIEDIITDMKSRFRQCGTFQCGEINNN